MTGGPTGRQNPQQAARAAFEALKLQAEMQERINKDASEYFSLLKKIGDIQKNLDHLQRQRARITAQLQTAIQNGNQAQIVASNQILRLLDREINQLQTIQQSYVQVGQETNKATVATKMLFKATSKIPALFQSGYGKLKEYGLFSMDKAVRSAALEMGILTKQSSAFKNSLVDTSLGIGDVNKSSIQLGLGIEELAQLQAGYSNQIGRMINFSDQANNAMAELAKGTTLGVQGTIEMVSEMDKIGKSAEATSEFFEKVLDSAHKQGLNASKVVQNIKNNFKLINQYSFKKGTDGLANMAELAAKIGTDMQLATGFADKLFDVEGAVEMSAQLQVLGGEWSKLADPFKLMNMARNEMDALYTSIVNATKGSAKFNAETQEFDIAPLELQRLRKVAEKTGLSFEQLSESAKKVARFANVEGQMKIKVDDKETADLISTMATFDKNGKAKISIDGDEKYIDALNASNLSRLKEIKDERNNLRERAKNALDFDTSVNNLINALKVSLTPFVDALTKSIGPSIDKFFKDKKFRKDLSDMSKNVADFLAGFLKGASKLMDLAIALGPKGTLATLFGAEVLFNAPKWIANGMSLGIGFNQVANASGGMRNMLGSGLRSVGGGSAKRGLKTAGIMGGAGLALNLLTNATTDPGSTMNILGNTIADGLTGAAMGAFLGPVGIALGGAIGAAYGGFSSYLSKKDSEIDLQPATNDGVFSSNFSKGRAILQGNTVTPIDNKDELIAAKPNGVFDKALSRNQKPSEVNVNFGKLEFSGNITLSNEDNTVSYEMLEKMMQNSDFLRSITKMIHMETTKAINGGKLSSQPA